VLRQLLELPALFRAVPERAAWTTDAHRNLERELSSLRDAS
jgi:predicted metal-dependent HD superfamily phosphohydrolase